MFQKRNWSQLVFDFTVKFTDGTPDLETRNAVADVMRWEENHGGESFVENTPAVSDLVWLAWCAAKRQHLTDDDFKLFQTRVSDFSSVPVTWDKTGDPEAGLDPTRTAQSDA